MYAVLAARPAPAGAVTLGNLRTLDSRYPNIFASKGSIQAVLDHSDHAPELV